MNVLVLMSGGFHPFHPGHLALYNSAKKTFPGADVVVGATNVQKDRPFNFKDKATLATIAGVDKGHFVEVNRQFSVKGEPNIENRIQNPDNTILIFVRSEKDANDPVLQPWKLNPDGSAPMTKGSKNHPPRPTSNYLLSYTGNEKKLQPMTKHAYIAFLPVEEFGSNMTSASEIRNEWPTLDKQGKINRAISLYPATQQNNKLLSTVVNILDKNLITTAQPVVAPATSAIKKLKTDKLKEHIQRMRPLLREANSEQKLKLLKLMKVALKEHIMEEQQVDEAKIHFTDPSTKVNLYYIPPKLEAQGKVQNIAHNIPYSTVEPLISRLIQKYTNLNPDYMVWYSVDKDKYGQRLEEVVAEGSEEKDNLIWTLNSFGYYSDNSSVYVNDDGDKIVRVGSEWKHQSGKRGRGPEELGNFLSSIQGVAEGSLEELANTSLKVKEPKDFVNINDRKQVTYKVMKFKSGKDTYLINFTVKGAPAFGKKQNWNAVNVSFGVREEQDDYSFGDEINTDLTAKNKNQFLIYSTVINAVRKFITEYNTEIDEIIMQGAGERQEAIYQRFFQSAGKYFPGWHHDGKHSLVRDVPRPTGKKVREQGVAESNDYLEEK
jgi:hypothetical protein